ncbi:hypothetical protein G6F31_019109 [Rhizopus arrhizus]|nr:hypothetical protein G6F31_019109 [Rhizopus arrhizus]
MVLMKVDLPAPLMPSSPMRWPACNEKLMPDTMILSDTACSGFGARRGSRNSNENSAAARSGATSSMRASALMRLCAWRALLAWAFWAGACPAGHSHASERP